MRIQIQIRTWDAAFNNIAEESVDIETEMCPVVGPLVDGMVRSVYDRTRREELAVKMKQDTNPTATDARGQAVKIEPPPTTIHGFPISPEESNIF